jgi:predicted transposase/invertase (TIGR01784 family)
MTGLLDPKLDYIFKTIFGTEEKKPLLISLLNAIFKGQPHIKDITLENTDIAKILGTNKDSRLDVKATSDDGTKLDIEIQCKNTGEIPRRARHYLANMVPTLVNSGESYKGPNVIGIWILGENVTKRQKAINDAYMTFQPNDLDPFQVMTDSMRIIFIELPKFNPKDGDAKDLLTAWLSFLKDPIFMDEKCLRIKEVKVAMETLKYISADDEVRAIADLRQKTINDYNSEMTVAREKGYEEGLEEVRKEGRQKEKIEIARSLLAKGISSETVKQCTQLSIEEIKLLQK